MSIPVTVKVNTSSSQSQASEDVFEYFQKKNTVLHLDASTISFRNLSLIKSADTQQKGELILGTKDIQNYVIKPIHRYQAVERYFHPGLLSPVIKQIDIQLNEVGKYLNVSYHLDPINMLEEKEKFIQADGKYNPNFEYKFPDEQRLEWIEQKLLLLQNEIQDIVLGDRIFYLFEEKLTELFCKLGLLKGYSEQDFTKIYKYQKRLYGDIQQ